MPKKKISDITITYLLKREILMKEKTWVMSLRMKKEGTYMQIVANCLGQNRREKNSTINAVTEVSVQALHINI